MQTSVYVHLNIINYEMFFRVQVMNEWPVVILSGIIRLPKLWYNRLLLLLLTHYNQSQLLMNIINSHFSPKLKNITVRKNKLRRQHDTSVSLLDGFMLLNPSFKSLPT